MIPGVTDVTTNGIPRPFDGFPDAKTHLFIRGNEKTPDESITIEPGVPSVLGLPLPEIQTVSLPNEAWQPERRSWVLDAHLKLAQEAIDMAESKLEQSTATLAKAEHALEKLSKEPKPAGEEPKPYEFTDDFEKLDTKRWKTFGGIWEHAPGKIDQKKDGANHSILRLLETPPDDFEATLRLSINGGSQWRSVGIEFDSSQDDPSANVTGSHSVQNVYMSGYAGGPKIHASFNKGGKWEYPAGAFTPIQFELGKEYTFKVQVRGTLINAYLDDKLIVSWYTQLARRPGAIQISVFDALPTLKQFTLRSLPNNIKLTAPKNQPIANSGSMQDAESAVASAKHALALAKLDLEVAKDSHSTMKLREVALKAKWSETDEDQIATSRVAAIRAQQKSVLLTAKRTLFDAESKLATSQVKQADLKKQVTEATTAVEAAQVTLDEPVPDDAVVESFTGAVWTPTRFFSSGKDDPKVEFHQSSTGRRTALANWITNQQHPLTARVAVNHIWLRHMGAPLVKTVFDFGRRGNRPTQLELLDWLAAELMESGWSMKHLHRLILLSDAYQLTSSLRDAEKQRSEDPENLLWWKRPPIRVESQVVRDSILALAGTIDWTMGGPPVEANSQATSKRRSLYFFHSNNSRNLFLETFDEALVKECYMRDQSIKPQQALAISNSQLVLSSAPTIAAQITGDGKDNPTFIRDAFATTLGITVTPDELVECLSALEQWERLPDGNDKTARGQLIWVLLNHNDFVTLR